MYSILNYQYRGESNNEFPVIDNRIISSVFNNKIRAIDIGVINHITDINQYLKNYYFKINDNQSIIGTAYTNEYYKNLYLTQFLIGRFLYFISFVVHRILPRMGGVWKKIYFTLYKGKHQRLSKAEVIGRIIKNGFKVEEIEERDGIIHFYATKNKIHPDNRIVSEGLIFKMIRTGQNGKPITVYKFRTMHPYSEYVQDYIKETNGLESSGKYKNDFRVTSWGRVLRKCWIDELPMIFNLLKGDIKLIGVRPISFSYLKLYPLEFSNFRNNFKPGLLPPFYADIPKNFEEIVSSEKEYLKKYQQDPFLTDLIYTGKILFNIFIKKSRSK
jgi:lipopolysaccharide/colanic/teichoic acid biosynthesis glycosyltransferase